METPSNDLPAGDAEEIDIDTFTSTFDFSANAGRLPALLQRSDGETVLYAKGKLNSIFGLPGTGKSWIAIMAIIEAVMRGGHVIFWDFETDDRDFLRRSLLLGFDPRLHKEQFKYVAPGLADNPQVMEMLKGWLLGAQDPTFSLVVIDAAESAGCPSDGRDVAPWFNKYWYPWAAVGATGIVVDHQAKHKEDRGRGAIGSTHKLSKVTGASLQVSGQPWSTRTGGLIFLHSHKDKGGDSPAALGKCVAVVKGEYQTIAGVKTFKVTIEPPAPQDDGEDQGMELLAAVAEAGVEGVTGLRAMRGLVSGTTGARDAVITNMVDSGMLLKQRQGNADNYSITAEGLALLT